MRIGTTYLYTIMKYGYPPKMEDDLKAFREIGEILGRSEVWARVRFYRGKEELTRIMGGDGR